MIVIKKANLETSFLLSIIKNKQLNKSFKHGMHTCLAIKSNKSLFSIAKKNIYSKKNDDLSIFDI